MLSFSLRFLFASIVLDRLKLLLSAYTQRLKTGNCCWNTGCLSLTFVQWKWSCEMAYEAYP